MIIGSISNRSTGIFPHVFPGLLFLSVVCIIELIAILVLNSGRFIYTLDDPYIHLTLAENIAKGHYGINPNEFSAPSSSMIWPFILAPFSFLRHFEMVPLILNFIASVGTVVYFTRIVRRSVRFDDKKIESIVITILLAGLIVCTNLVTLIFSGMEHSLQVLISVMILDGLIADSENESHRLSVALPIIIAPLIRYENLALSLAAIGFLCVRRRFGIAIFCVVFIALSEAVFSMYLSKMGLGPIPTSILAKTTVGGGEKDLLTILYNMTTNLATSFITPRAILLIGSLVVMSIALWTGVKKRGRLIALTISSAIVVHLLAGAYGVYNRYGIYIWTVAVLTLIYLFGEVVYRFLVSPAGRKRLPVLAGVFTSLTVIACFPYINNVCTLPVASNNIYEQQFQMRRFAVDYFKKPVAVNDIGLLSYRNGNYILDLFGLASLKAFKGHRTKHSDGVAWMDELVKTSNVRFAMLYDVWFPRVPDNWIRVGELHLGRKRIAPADSVVAFYACDNGICNESRGLLKEFGKTLPRGVRFVEK